MRFISVNSKIDENINMPIKYSYENCAQRRFHYISSFFFFSRSSLIFHFLQNKAPKNNTIVALQRVLRNRNNNYYKTKTGETLCSRTQNTVLVQESRLWNIFLFYFVVLELQLHPFVYSFQSFDTVTNTCVYIHVCTSSSALCIVTSV